MTARSVLATLAAALCALAVISPSALPTPNSSSGLSGPRGTSAAKVLVIGIDGVRWDTLRAQMAGGRAPNLKALADGGFLTPSYLPSGRKLGQTLSGPSWNAILRGVWEDKHRVDSNSDCDYDKHVAHPDFLTRIERARPALSTFSAATWGNITSSTGCGPYVSDQADAKFHRAGSGDDVTADEAARHLTANGPDAGFVHLDDVDIAGHASGATSAAYRAAIDEADRQVGRLVAAITGRSTVASERWQVLVTTDHGHVDGGGHGGQSIQERTGWIIGAELGQTTGTLPRQVAVLPGKLRITDIAPTALAHVGLTQDPAWQLDGRRIGTPGTDPFDSLSGALKPAVDERPEPFSNAPGQLYGFTHTAPSGWSIVNGSGIDRGTTEWRGWSFTTDPFWTGAQRGQEREEFGDGRGVFAVADGDEFNDTAALASAQATLDTTLVSPGYPVGGARTATVFFADYYRQDTRQTAEVTVSFDGAAPARILRYGPTTQDANRGGTVRSHRATLPVAVPAGARSMVVRWRYIGQNDWFWAIDDPQVTTAR